MLQDTSPNSPGWWYVNAVGLAGIALAILLACIPAVRRAVFRRYSNWRNNGHQYIQAANPVEQV